MTARVYGGVPEDVRRSERRKRLIEAAYSLLATDGPAAVTVAGVCRDAGLSPRYFYEAFDNRDALIQQIIDDETDAVITQIRERAVSTPGGARERGEAAVNALLDALDADGRRAALGRASDRDDLLLRFRDTVNKRMAGELAAELGKVAGYADRSDRVAIASTLIIVGIDQLSIDWLVGEMPMDRDRLVAISVQFAVATLEDQLGGAE